MLEPFVLEGAGVRLEPLTAGHAAGLAAACPASPHQPDDTGGMSEPVDLIRDGDGGQLRPEQGDQLAAEQDAQITGLPQGRDVNEDASLRHYHLR